MPSSTEFIEVCLFVLEPSSPICNKWLYWSRMLAYCTLNFELANNGFCWVIRVFFIREKYCLLTTFLRMMAFHSIGNCLFWWRNSEATIFCIFPPNVSIQQKIKSPFWAHWLLFESYILQYFWFDHGGCLKASKVDSWTLFSTALIGSWAFQKMTRGKID